MKIYLASSWRNHHYPKVLQILRDAGHEVYDFREGGFRWDEIEPGFTDLSNKDWVNTLVGSEQANEHFQKDFAALDACDLCILLLPCGRSAHLEAGYAAGCGKKVHVMFGPEKIEPELMYLMTDHIYLTTDLREPNDAPKTV